MNKQIRLAGLLGTIASLALAGTALAHHTIEGPCEAVLVLSEQGTVVKLTGAATLEFGPLGPGEWPTEYLLEPVPTGQYHAEFWQGEELDAANDLTVEPCPTPTPSATPEPTPTPEVTPTPTPNQATPHPTKTPPDTATLAGEPAQPLSPGDVLLVLATAVVAPLAALRLAPARKRG